MKTQFTCTKATVTSKDDSNIVSISFDVATSRGVMLFFTRAHKANQIVSVKITPIHDPKAMILEVAKPKSKKKSELVGVQYGFAVDEVDTHGKPTNMGLMPVSAFNSYGNDPGPVDVGDTFDTTPAATAVEIVPESDPLGQILLTLRLTFAKPVIAS